MALEISQVALVMWPAGVDSPLRTPTIVPCGRASGIGHRASGIGHRASGIGHRASGSPGLRPSLGC
ncbi:MAG: hypothetical protein DYH12_02385 [Sorangiineae bacterium PRO1]|nr:hypothetical protein [Sorangiineae bacterium PRO1]